jgi:hypothetical protein
MPIETNLNKSQSSNYQLVIGMIPTESSLQATRELTLNIFGTVLPSINIAQNLVYWMGAATKQDGEMTFDDWTVNYIVDSNFDNWKVLYNWMTFVRNEKDKFGEIPRLYAIKAMLRILDNFRQPVLVVEFENVWVTGMGEVNLTHRDYDTNLESTVTLSYDSYHILESAQ